MNSYPTLAKLRLIPSAELAPEHRRGQLATLWQLAITTGIVFVSILNIWLADWTDGWRISYGGNIVFALILIGMLKIMPESPRYLVAKGKREEAQAALAKVRYEDQLDWEIENIDCEVKEEMAQGVATWPEIFSDDNQMKYRVLMGMGLQTIQQLSGMFNVRVCCLCSSSSELTPPPHPNFRPSLFTTGINAIMVRAIL
jgi:MFS family permease